MLAALALTLSLVMLSSLLAGPLIRSAVSNSVLWPVALALASLVALLLAVGALLFLVLPRYAPRP